MRGVEVQSAVIHLLGHRTSRRLVLSDRALDLDDERLRIFIRDHVASGLTDRQVRTRRFARPLTEVAKTAQQIVQRPRSLLNPSKELASRLHAILQSNRTISPGSLMVARCVGSFEPGSEPEPFAALLKLDASTVFTPRFKTEGGATRVWIEELKDPGLPSTREPLQKAALIRSLSDDDGDGVPLPHELLILDRQRQGEPAQFFSDTFLSGVEDAFTPAQQTQQLVRGARAALTKVRPDLDKTQTERVYRAIENLADQETVERDAWAGAIRLPRPQREVFRKALEKEVPDPIIQVDAPTVQEGTKWIRFKGRNGFRMRIDAANRRTLHRLETSTSDRKGFTRLVIEVEDLTEY